MNFTHEVKNEKIYFYFSEKIFEAREILINLGIEAKEVDLVFDPLIDSLTENTDPIED